MMRPLQAKAGRRLFFGMIHLPPLPGAPRCNQSVDASARQAIADAETLAAGGVDGLIIENFGDSPFYPKRVPAETVAAMSVITSQIRLRRKALLLGVNVLRNDAESAMAIAAAADCDFIRVNVLHGARLTDQGIISGKAHRLSRLRRQLDAQTVRIFADVNVKHSAPLADIPIEHEVEELLQRSGAEGVIVSGAATGAETSNDEVQRVKLAAGDRPVLIGSGVNADNCQRYPNCDGFIVGTSLKRDGILDHPVDPVRVAECAEAIRSIS